MLPSRHSCCLSVSYDIVSPFFADTLHIAWQIEICPIGGTDVIDSLHKQSVARLLKNKRVNLSENI